MTSATPTARTDARVARYAVWFGLWPDGYGGAYWWLGSRFDEPTAGHASAVDLGPLLDQLDLALPHQRDGESEQDAVTRAAAGALAKPAAEADLSTALGNVLLPKALREHLDRAGDASDPAVTVVIAPGPTLSRIPWELLTVPGDGRRLLEVVHVRGGLSPANIYNRARQPAPADGPALRIIDPGPSHSRIYTPAELDRWERRCEDDGATFGTADSAEGGPLDRDRLHRLLTDRRPSRLLYVGHATPGPADRPAAAAVLLNDGPLTAAEWIRDPHRWPLPPRVALIACHSNDTHSPEQMGLVIAAANSGAELITTTRWVLPSDRYAPGGLHATATTGLAEAVDDAHAADQPLHQLRTWQLQRLHAWRQQGIGAAPLLWAAPVTYHAASDPAAS